MRTLGKGRPKAPPPTTMKTMAVDLDEDDEEEDDLPRRPPEPKTQAERDFWMSRVSISDPLSLNDVPASVAATTGINWILGWLPPKTIIEKVRGRVSIKFNGPFPPSVYTDNFRRDLAERFGTGARPKPDGVDAEP